MASLTDAKYTEATDFVIYACNTCGVLAAETYTSDPSLQWLQTGNIIFD
jgi:hypothetical protein